MYLYELLDMFQQELLVAGDVVGLASKWGGEIVKDDVVCASAYEKCGLADKSFGSFLTDGRLKFCFVLFEILQLPLHRNYTLIKSRSMLTQ